MIRLIKSRRMRMAGHVRCMGAKKNAYRALVGNPEGKRPLGRPRLEDNVKLDLREIGWGGGTDLIHLSRDMDQWLDHVNMVKNLWVP
jgi:hypothetical protein